jgi:D-glycero-alpha-D-manno-heptose-7-phosphate kinase
MENLDQKKTYYKKIYSSVEKAEKILLSKKKNFMFDFGVLMNEQWKLKKKLAKNVSNKKIDKIYNKALKLGAIGGKLCGSGGGGFFIRNIFR